MRTFTNLITFLSLILLPSKNVFASEVLKNCFSRGAQYFTLKLEDIAVEKYTPILLLNSENEVVGLISVEPDRAEKYPHIAKRVEIHQLSLCSSLEVSRFYYTDGPSANLLEWQNASEAQELVITQDEGMLRLEVKVEKEETYATYMSANFKAYDYVDPEVTDAASDEAKAHPDFDKDWGMPKGKGTFYFYVPKNWKP